MAVEPEHPGGAGPAGQKAHAARHSSRHDEAIIQAEVRRLCRALAPYGTLTRKQLGAIAQADQWHQGSFDSALEIAVRTGAIRALPFNFYQDPARLAHNSTTAPKATCQHGHQARDAA